MWFQKHAPFKHEKTKKLKLSITLPDCQYSTCVQHCDSFMTETMLALLLLQMACFRMPSRNKCVFNTNSRKQMPSLCFFVFHICLIKVTSDFNVNSFPTYTTTFKINFLLYRQKTGILWQWTCIQLSFLLLLPGESRGWVCFVRICQAADGPFPYNWGFKARCDRRYCVQQCKRQQAHRRCLSLQSATITSRLPNTVMMIMMERKMVRTIVSSELRNSCCCCSCCCCCCCCCPVFNTSSNKL